MNHESALAVEEAPSKRKRHRNRYQDGHLLQFRLAALTAAVPRSRPGPCRCTEARSLPRWPSPGNLWGWPSATAAADQRRWIRLGRWAGWWRKCHRNRYPGGHRLQLCRPRRLRFRRHFCSAARPLPRWLLPRWRQPPGRKRGDIMATGSPIGIATAIGIACLRQLLWFRA